MPVIPASPPKRMTRARAKAVEDKTKITKVTTASSRAATATKPTAAQRKTVVEDDDEIEIIPTKPARKVSTKPTLAESRRGVSTKPAPATASARTTQSTESTTVSKTKARPRKDTTSEESSAPAQSSTSTATRSRARAEPAARNTTAKKTVTSQDRNEDKENAVVAVSKSQKSTHQSTGIAAKPVRKTAATGVSAKKAVALSKSAAKSQPRTAPLSPKKDTQVAKGSVADGLEDAGPSELAESVDELQLDAGPCTSPIRNMSSSIMCSPARRPPNSPFKDSFKESPRRLGAMEVCSAGSTALPSSLSQSPKKFNMSSPSKNTIFDAPSGDLGKSLFGSPARKPSSPVKSANFGSPTGPKFVQKDLSRSILTSKSPQRFTPAKDLAAISKAAEVESIKCLLATVEEHAASLEDELLNAPSPFSPVKEALGKQTLETTGSNLECFEERHEQEAGLEQILDRMDIDTPQPASKTQKTSYPPRTPGSPAYFDDESEDELSTDNVYYSTPAVHKARLSTHFRCPVTPTEPGTSTTPEGQAPQESLTVLAQRFGQWQTATPDPAVLDLRKGARSVFSPLPHLARPSEDDNSSPNSTVSTPGTSHEAPASFFDDAMPIVIHEDVEDSLPFGERGEDLDQDQETQDLFRQSQMSEASQIYGDENKVPIDPALFEAPASAPLATDTCTPGRIHEERPQVIHTVSKVPLKGCDDFDASPLVMPKKRSRSLAGALSPHADLELQAMRQIHPSASFVQTEQQSGSQAAVPGSDLTLMMPSGLEGSHETAPGNTSGADNDILKGAVVFVDVHTAEGADASGLFVELLTQMGAKCVKTWTWNSRASGSVSEAEPATPMTKVGITHVVFKDGGKRTMEKVRESHGRVSCVGVGWVLDCERNNKWLDEADYAVDISTIPRGGHRRRKSMEPRSLSQSNGELISNISPKKFSPPQMSPTKEFLNLNSPDRRVSFGPVQQSPHTPVAAGRWDADAGDFTTPNANRYEESNFGSPTTPYFLHPTQLVQQTCPPKQSQELFFPVSGRISDQPNESMRQRLLLARRKSLQFAPKVGSPLALEDF